MMNAPAYVLLALAGCASTPTATPKPGSGCGAPACPACIYYGGPIYGDASPESGFAGPASGVCGNVGYPVGYAQRVDGGYIACCEGEEP